MFQGTGIAESKERLNRETGLVKEDALDCWQAGLCKEADILHSLNTIARAIPVSKKERLPETCSRLWKGHPNFLKWRGRRGKTRVMSPLQLLDCSVAEFQHCSIAQPQPQSQPNQNLLLWKSTRGKSEKERGEQLSRKFGVYRFTHCTYTVLTITCDLWVVSRSPGDWLWILFFQDWGIIMIKIVLSYLTLSLIETHSYIVNLHSASYMYMNICTYYIRIYG